jgi:dual specificity MAP kinase phosphatase
MTSGSVPDVSAITDYLYISAWPRGNHAEEIRAMNVRLILSMHWFKPAQKLGDDPIRLLWLPTVDNPLFPMPIRSLWLGVDAALPVIASGYKVLAHCRAGVHRSVAMACCVLIGRGMSSSDAMALVKVKRSAADPEVWYIRCRILEFERQWLAGERPK